ncbi:hypothetical protein SCAR479_09493 [Seiridium cardinale]|uniref:Uncharacterized protein n=1 Tax=Seiridium cardinale TaxID=138064 RepID=A0ABR2XJD1_9PEZI
MPDRRGGAGYLPTIESEYPSDYAKKNGIEIPHSPSPTPEKMESSAIKKTRPKDKNFLTRFVLHRRSRKLKTKSERNEVDYRERWPTVTTLVTQPSDSRFFHDIDKDDLEKNRSAKAKALEAVSTPLEWLADRLGSISEQLGHQVEVADAKAQKKPNMPSSRKGSTKPGGSTHPYDTGVEVGMHEEGDGDKSLNLTLQSPAFLPNHAAGTRATKAGTHRRPSQGSGRHGFRRRSDRSAASKHSRNTTSPEFEVADTDVGSSFDPDADDEDVPDIPKPRSKRKPIAGRRASAYPEKEREQDYPHRRACGTAQESLYSHIQTNQLLKSPADWETGPAMGARQSSANKGSRSMSSGRAPSPASEK